MKQSHFNLICHPANHPGPEIRIDGHIQRRQALLAIVFLLHDPAGRIFIPAPAVSATRTHGLWERTCFECFIAVDDANGYWEINLSPAGDWNVYRFDDYRLGMREAQAIEALPLMVERKETTLVIGCDLDLNPLATPRQQIKVGLSAVVQDVDGEHSYWALAHPGPRPDFHHPDGFVLAL